MAVVMGYGVWVMFRVSGISDADEGSWQYFLQVLLVGECLFL